MAWRLRAHDSNLRILGVDHLEPATDPAHANLIARTGWLAQLLVGALLRHELIEDSRGEHEIRERRRVDFSPVAAIAR